MELPRTTSERSRIALVTNHGYAGIDIPVGGAPDTGGQNFYVNSLAEALDEAGFDVTIFSRGGFLEFESDKIRTGIDQMTPHVRYVYVPGGGKKFIPKEDIAVALDEQVVWIEQFIEMEAREANILPWEFYEIINTHYWDAAIITLRLIERWKNKAALAFLSEAVDGKFAPHIKKRDNDQINRLCLSREIHLHLGQLAMEVAGTTSLRECIYRLTGASLDIGIGFHPEEQDKIDFLKTIRLGKALTKLITVDNRNLFDALAHVDTHVWTPHSLGIIKERNFWEKEWDVLRRLKFRERDAHEQLVCKHTPLFCSTSPEIWRAMVSYHGLDPISIFDFPPCTDSRIFYPRPEEELTEVRRFLSKKSGIDSQVLRDSLIVFETSRMDHTKRKDILLGAFAEVAKKRNDVYLFIGGGPEESPVFKSLQKQIETVPALKGRAFLLGYVTEALVEPLFSAADLFVSASEMEGFGMSVSQAAAAGVAIVSSDLIPFATQYSKDAAVVVPAGYQHGFATAMDRLLSDGEERSRRAAQLLEVAAEFDWVTTANRFVSWYRRRRTADLPERISQL